MITNVSTILLIINLNLNFSFPTATIINSCWLISSQRCFGFYFRTLVLFLKQKIHRDGLCDQILFLSHVPCIHTVYKSNSSISHFKFTVKFTVAFKPLNWLFSLSASQDLSFHFKLSYLPVSFQKFSYWGKISHYFKVVCKQKLWLQNMRNKILRIKVLATKKMIL